jgi:hypothetical protein
MPAILRPKGILKNSNRRAANYASLQHGIELSTCCFEPFGIQSVELGGHCLDAGHNAVQHAMLRLRQLAVRRCHFGKLLKKRAPRLRETVQHHRGAVVSPASDAAAISRCEA